MTRTNAFYHERQKARPDTFSASFSAFSKKASLVVLMAFLTSCGTNGLDELKRLCEKDAGLTIYKTVEADGYYDTTGGNADLIHSDYQFFEYCDDSPTIVDLTPDPGCWRVSKVKRNTGRCYAPLDKRLAKFIVEPYPEFLENHCMAVEKIDKPRARYSYHSGLKSWPAKNGVSEFIRSYALFKEVQSGDILSEYISYSYNKRPRHTSPISCHSLEDKYSVSIKADFIEKTIISHKEK